MTYFRRLVAELRIEPQLGLNIAAATCVITIGVRGGSEKSLKNGHDQEHGDENSSSHETKRHRIDGAIEISPLLIPRQDAVRRWRSGRWPSNLVVGIRIRIGIAVF